MSEVQFHIHRKAAFAGALLPYQIHINGLYVGTIRNGKSLHVSVPKADTYFIEDDILFSRNAVLFDNGLPEYSLVIKRAGGWRTESYNEFYIDKGEDLEQLPSFHWEGLFEPRQTLSPSEKALALCLEFWMFATDDLQEVLASENLFEITAALHTIGAQEYHDLLINTMNDYFCDVEFPLDDDKIEQMRHEIEYANRAFWHNKKAKNEFREAVAHFLTAKLNDSDLIF